MVKSDNISRSVNTEVLITVDVSTHYTNQVSQMNTPILSFFCVWSLPLQYFLLKRKGLILAHSLRVLPITWNRRQKGQREGTGPTLLQ